MCGIAGFVNLRREQSRCELEQLALNMAATLHHRGPDDGGVWADAKWGVGLGHRRLAIQDLSMEGHQPMHSVDGRYVIIFNGEIYNFKELRQNLEQRGCTFRGHSDTEVMLAAFCEWGIEPAIERFVGMFAFALWDREQGKLHLARDRAGEKPLYYGWSGGAFLFGSELKALRIHPQWHGELDRGSLSLFLRHNYIPAPHSIYRNIFKLPPGSILTLTAAQFEARENPAPRAYWSMWSVAETGVAGPFRGSAREATDRLTELLRESVKSQMVADVPLGAFLSGGIDSSTVVALMQEQSRRPVKTFSIGFGEKTHDESPYAKAVARHLGTDHTELYLHPGILKQAIPRLPEIYDEPFADTSHVPTVLLSELARKQVTVCLSGDGGDELFGGYSHYLKTARIWRTIRNIPRRIRRRLGGALHGIAAAGIEMESRLGREPRLFKRMLRLSELLPVPSHQALYQLLISHCRDPQNWLAEGTEPPWNPTLSAPWQTLPELLQRMMYWDFVRYLPDEILVKVDRAAMSVSLETRIPLLDHRLVEFAWRLPSSLRRRHGKSKWLLRQVLHQYVPAELVERPKQGFAAPVEDWIRGELRPWAEDLLAESTLRRDGFFKEGVVRQKWNEHLSRKGDWGAPLWNVLMFQAWWEHHKRTPQIAATFPASRTSAANPVEFISR
jgi:asparagine synthase (glutamine-hydrolysing)